MDPLAVAMARSPPGPKGEPIFGVSRTYSRDPLRFVEAVESAYGDLARFEMGPLETYMVAEPSAIERVLVSDADRFRKPDFRDDALGDLLGSGLLLSEGETWDRQRRLANPAFAASRIAGMADRITDHAAALVDSWSPGDVVDVERAMTTVTLDVILDLMMDVELPRERVEMIQDRLVPLGRRFEPNPVRFAAPSWLPLPGDAEFASAVAGLDEVLDEIVAERAGTVGEGSDGPTDLLSILLRARDRGEQSDEQLRDELMTTLLAGHDTTALALTYTWFLLSEHPAAERRVHGELDAVLAGDRPAMEHVREFAYVDRVIDESMRLYPPVYTLFRQPTEPVELAGHVVPEGAAVMLPQWAVHRSARFWEDPDTFDPSRWRPERSRDRHRFAFFPFGGGPRHCIGKHLALLEAKLILATIAHEYRLEFLGRTPLSLQPSLTIHPRQRMRMRVVER